MEQKRRLKRVLTAGVCLLILAALVSVRTGSYPLSVFDIIDILLNRHADAMGIKVFYQLRLPRVVLGILAGYTLGMVGAIFQILFRNPLATPDLLGVASGAGLGAAAAIVFGTGTSAWIMGGAFLGGMGVLILVLVLVGMSGRMRGESYILAGVAVSALANAMIMILKYKADPEGELAAIEFWMMGSLASVTASKVMSVAVPVCGSALALLLMRKQIFLLGIGDESAFSLGMHVPRVKMALLTVCTLATSCIVAVTGVISFVGLLAPHLAYLLIKMRSRGYLVTSGMIGAVLVVLADCFARTAGEGEMPVSILTTLCAVPFLLFFMWKQREEV